MKGKKKMLTFKTPEGLDVEVNAMAVRAICGAASLTPEAYPVSILSLDTGDLVRVKGAPMEVAVSLEGARLHVRNN